MQLRRKLQPQPPKKKYKPRAVANTKGEKAPHNPEEIAACLACRVPGDCNPGHRLCGVKVMRGMR